MNTIWFSGLNSKLLDHLCYLTTVDSKRTRTVSTCHFQLPGSTEKTETGRMLEREVPSIRQTGVRLMWKILMEMPQSYDPPENADYLSVMKIRRLEQQERRIVLRDNMADKP